MAQQDPDDASPSEVDPLVAQEESAAAAEAARIGGVVRPASEDPAMEPLYEAGEGEQEGWELAEAELIENASHGDGLGDPERDAFTPEAEADRATAAYGEADGLESTELDEDSERTSAGPARPRRGTSKGGAGRCRRPVHGVDPRLI